MERTYKISDETRGLLNLIVNLNEVSNSFYSYVRKEYSLNDSLDDKTGDDIIEATRNLRDIFYHYLQIRLEETTGLTPVDGKVEL